jgi:hypothetical protein
MAGARLQSSGSTSSNGFFCAAAVAYSTAAACRSTLALDAWQWFYCDSAAHATEQLQQYERGIWHA